MINLKENFHCMPAIPPTSANAGRTGDYILMENAHAIWTIVTLRRPTAGGCAVTHEVASDFAGTGSSAVSTGILTWASSGHLRNRGEYLRPKTSSAVGYTFPSATGIAFMISRFDPAAVMAKTSNTHYTVKTGTLASANDGVTAMYFVEPRYKGVEYLLATTSST